ncbi:hypothetical protein GW932_05465, partial [archaeon]|nr:hypothetical protein [archaeon]
EIDNKTTDTKIGNVEDTFSTVATAAGSETAIGKSAGIASATISTFKGIGKTLETYPFPLSAIMAIAQGALGFAQVSKIAGISTPKPNKTLPKAAMGGELVGASHLTGGIKLEGEGGEFIVNKAAMSNPNYSSIVKQINSAGNGGSTPQFNQIDDSRIAEIAAKVVGSIDVSLNETARNEKEKEITIRESKFTQ